jgi:hypothetical protein
LRALHGSKTKNIVDLCSGSGGPWSSLVESLTREDDSQYNITLTDWAPNLSSLAAIKQRAGAHISFSASSVDATNVPAELTGFRTIFAAFHHFNPDQAQNILQNAVDNHVGIGIFEITERTPMGFLVTILGGAMAFITVPFMKPFSWSRLIFTYLIPIIPIAISFDGVISCLRTYTPQELEQFTQKITAPGYTWDIGRIRHNLCPVICITYLIGYPLAQEPTY